MTGRWKRWTLPVLLALGLGLGGCGDSNVFDGQADDGSDQAKKEAGLQALNDGSWDEAIALFGDLYDADQPDPEVVKYLSSAYVGKAGFDTLQLVADIAEAEDEGGANTESIVYDSVTRLFDLDGDGVIEQAELTDEGGKIELLERALRLLLPGYDLVSRQAALAASGPTDEQRFQAGLYAAVHAVLTVVVQLEDPDHPGTLLLTLDALAAKADRVLPNVTAPASLDLDLSLVDDAKEVLISDLVDPEDQNDIAEEFTKFLEEVGYVNGGSPGHVTDLELRTYLSTLLARVSGKMAVEVTP